MDDYINPISAKRQAIYALFKHVDIDSFPDNSFELNPVKQSLYRKILKADSKELDVFDIVEKHTVIDNYQSENLEKVQFAITSKQIDKIKLGNLVRLFFGVLGNDQSRKGLIDNEELIQLDKSRRLNRYWTVTGVGKGFSVMIDINEIDGLTLRVLV